MSLQTTIKDIRAWPPARPARRSGPGSSSPLASRQRLHQRRHRRRIDRSSDPHPPAGRKLDLNHAGSLGHRRRRCRFRLRRDRDRIERRRNLGPLTQLLAPAKQLAGMDPAARATSEATAPGSMAAATIRSFSARDQLRRRCTDVITSTCVLVIGVVLGLLLGLAPMAQLRKAVLTGRLHFAAGHVDHKLGELGGIARAFWALLWHGASMPRAPSRCQRGAALPY